MLEKYVNQIIYHNHVTTVPLPGFDFVVYYAEIMSQDIVVFAHRHCLYEIFYGLEGTIYFSCDGEEAEVGPHGMLFLDKDCPHQLLYRGNSKTLYFSLIFDLIPRKNASAEAESEYREIIESLTAVVANHYILIPEAQPHEVILARIRETISKKRIGWASQAGLYYYIFFLDLLQQISGKRSTLAKPMGHENAALEATKYIHANLQSNLSADNVAQHLNITSRHLNRLFQEMFGASFVRTVGIIRLEYAKRCLCESDESVEQIAARVGFSSSKSMTKLFYEQEGMSPAFYRKLHRRR